MKQKILISLFSIFLIACNDQSNSISSDNSGNTNVEIKNDHPPVSSNLRLSTDYPIPVSSQRLNIEYDFNDIDGDEESLQEKYISYYLNGNKIGGGNDFIIPDYSSKVRLTAELIVVSKTGSERYSSFTSKLSFDVLPKGSRPIVSNLDIYSYDDSIKEGTILFTDYTFNDLDGDLEDGTLFQWIDLETGNVLATGNSIKLDAITKDLNIELQITPKTNVETSHGYNIGEIISKNISSFEKQNAFLYQYEIPNSEEDAAHTQYIIKSKNNYVKNYFSLSKGYENELENIFQTHIGIYRSFEDKNYTLNNGYLVSEESVKILLPPRFYDDYDEIYQNLKTEEEVREYANSEEITEENRPLDFDIPLTSPNGSEIKQTYFTNRSMNRALHSNAVLYEDNSLYVFDDLNGKANFFDNNGSAMNDNTETLGIPFFFSPSISNYSFDKAKTEKELPSITPNSRDSLYLPYINVNSLTSELMDKNSTSDLSLSGEIIGNVKKKKLKGMRENEQFADSIDIVETATTLTIGGPSKLNFWLDHVKNLAGGTEKIKSIIAYQNPKDQNVNRIIWEDEFGSYVIDTISDTQNTLVSLPFSFDNSEITMSCMTADISGYSSNNGFGQFYALDNDKLYLVGMEFGQIAHSVLNSVNNVDSFTIFDKYGESCHPRYSNIQKTSGVVYKKDGTINIYMIEGIKGDPVFEINTIDGSISFNESNGKINYNYEKTLKDSVLNKITNEGLLIGDVEIIIDVHFETIFAFNKDLNKLILLDIGDSLLNNSYRETIIQPVVNDESLLVIDDVYMIAKHTREDKSDANTLFLDLYGNVIPLNRNTWYYKNATSKETFESIYPDHYNALNKEFSTTDKLTFESTLETTQEAR